MWRHIKGVMKQRRKNKHKRKPDEEIEKEEGTTKKNRWIYEKWNSGREWLVYDPGVKNMYCIDCRTYDGEKQFVLLCIFFLVQIFSPLFYSIYCC